MLSRHREQTCPAASLQRTAQIGRLRELHRDAVAHARLGRRGSAADGPFDAVPRAMPAVLVGDFNYRPEQPEHALLQADIDAATPRLRDAWPIANPGVPHQPTVGVYDKQQWPDPAFACDFVCVSDDLVDRVRSVRVDATTAASDHQPMLLELD